MVKYSKILLLLVAFITILNSDELKSKQSSKKIIFLSNRDGNYQIYAMDKDGTNVKRITKSPEVKYSPRVSPDGKKVVFTNEDNQLKICDINGNNEIVLSESDERCSRPSWFHDSKRILFSSTRGGFTNSDGNPVKNIWSMNIDGTNAVQLTYSNFVNNSPMLSPNGDKIVFVSYRDKILFSFIQETYYAYRAQIYIMNVDGSSQKRLTALNPGLNYKTPSFTPDGKKIVYTMEFAMKHDDNKWSHICIMNVDGSYPTRLSPINAEHTFPYCTPDGQKILFDAMINGSSPIMRMNIDGSNIIRLSKDSYINYFASYK